MYTIGHVLHPPAASPAPHPATAADFLRNMPGGPYTTARTVDQTSVFEWQLHVERLVESARDMAAAAGQTMHSNFCTPEAFEVVLQKHVADAMRYFLKEHPQWRNEMKITVLLLPPGELWTHIAPLQAPSQPPIKVLLAGRPRANATTKDSEWVRERQALEALKTPEIEDIVLVGEGDTLVEGTQTNFFAVVDGAVWTAGEGILEGTVRKVALEVCKTLGLPIVLRPPTIAHLQEGRVQGAFISSTSRLVMPVDSIVLGDERSPAVMDTAVEFSFQDPDEIVTRIQTVVADEVLSRSTRVLQ